MDCRTALEILEVARPGSGDLSEPELAEAAAHVESHAECRQEFQRRQRLDREIGAALREVPVPTDLKARLLAELAISAESLDVAEPLDTAEPVETANVLKSPAKAETVKSRRHWLRMAAGSAACLVAGFAAWQFLPGRPEPIDAGVLLNLAAAAINAEDFRFDRLDDFQAGDQAELPDDWRAVQRLRISGPKAVLFADGPESAIAMYRFAFKRRGRDVTGYLLVLSADMLQNAPARQSLGGASTVYPQGMTARSWTSGEFVYVCIVPSGDVIDALRSLLSPRTA